MSELEQLGRDARAELGEPSELWLQGQRQRLRREPAARRRNPLQFRLVAALAALVGFALALGFVGSRRASPQASPPMAFSAGAEPKRVQLDDGTSAALGPGSSAIVAREPSTTRFELERGSAEFDVAPQRSRHFIVRAGVFEIVVVGTRFSVRHEPGGAVDVAVTRGIVSVAAPGRGAPVRLSAGQRFLGTADDLATLSPTRSPDASPSSARAVGSVPAHEPPLAPSALAPARAALSSGDWERAYRERRYAAALALARERGFDQLLTTLPARQLADLADAGRLGGDPELALRAYAAIERRFPSSAEASDAGFLVGRVHATRGDSSKALARFERYLQQHGDHAAYAVEAMGRLVELHAGRGDTERARAMAKKYLERAPDGPYRRLCVSVLGKP